MKSMKIGLWLTVLLAVMSTFVHGQGITTGSISGTVQDSQQAVIAGATITAVQIGTNAKFASETGSTGGFTLRGLPVGQYEITIEAPKFSKRKLGSVAVSSGQQTSLGVQTLAVGGSETVVVEGGVAPMVQTDTMQIGQSFETRKLADLPIGNGFDLVALLTPGVAPAGDMGFSNSNGADISANGQRGRANNFQIDGQSNNDSSIGGPVVFFGNQDAIAEVQVLTNYSAEYGRNAGSVVNYITKSGTNAWHGTAYEYYQGNWADSYANQEKSPVFGFCQPGQAVGTVTQFTGPAGCTAISRVPRNVDHRYGGTLGAPIAKDKLWFFVSGHHNTVRGAATPTSSAPFITPTVTGLTQLESAFPGNPAVATLRNIGPTAPAAGNAILTNTQTVLVNGVPIEFGQITRTVPVPYDDWEGTGRVDYQLSSKDRIFGRYVIQDQLFDGVQVGNGNLNAVQATAVGGYVTIPARTHQIGLDWTRSFTPGLVNQLHYSYGHADVGFEGGGFPNCIRADVLNCPTSVQFGDGVTSGFGLANSMPQGRKIINTQIQNNASWQKGRHLFKFGGEYGRQRQPSVFLPVQNGVYNYLTFDDFINGTPTAGVSLTLGSPDIKFVENQGAFYVQDDWKVRDNLTLSLGMRYEIADQAVNVLHRTTTARESNAATSIWDTSLPLELRTVPSIPVDKNNWGPVIGFAWTPRVFQGLFGVEKTVIRGGFRISYEPEFYNMFLNVATSSPAVNAITGLTCTNCLPASGLGSDVQAALSNALPPGVNPGLRNQTTVDPDFHSPYSEQWNLGFQREISSKAVAEVRYVGNHGVGLFQTVTPNVALNPLIAAGFSNVIPSGVTPCTTAGQPGAALGYQDCAHRKVLQRANTAFSIYHSLQSRFDIRNWHGVTSGVSYTFSHNIDNSSEVFSTVAAGNTLAFAQNPFDSNRPERANSGLDFPHIASIYLLYDLPWHRDQKGFVGHLLGGWQLNPVWRFVSGQPYTVIQSRFAGANAGICDPSGVFSTLFSACRPFVSNPGAPIDSVGTCTDATAADCGLVNFYTGDPMSASAAHWIVNETEAQNFFGTPFGNSRRNTQRGETINNMNLSIMKSVKLTERIGLQLRGVAYNVLNRQYRGNPDPILDNGNFGDLQGTFGNNFFNPSGGSQTNSVFSGIDRRRIEIGAKITF